MAARRALKTLLLPCQGTFAFWWRFSSRLTDIAVSDASRAVTHYSASTRHVTAKQLRSFIKSLRIFKKPEIVQRTDNGVPRYAEIPSPLESGGKKWLDEYLWMFNRDSHLAAALKAEKAYFDHKWDHFIHLEKDIHGELASRSDMEAPHFPETVGPWEYFMKETESGHVFARRRVDGSREQVLLDPTSLSRDGSAAGIKALVVSPDNAWVAYLYDPDGAGSFVLGLRNVDTSEAPLAGHNVSAASVAFSRDSSLVVYAHPDSVGTPREVLVHQIGGDPALDVCVFEEEREGSVVEVIASKDHEHVIISSNSRGSSEVHLLDAREPVSDPVLVQPREDGLEYFVQPVMGHLVILTNAGGTDDYWVAVCPAEKTTKEHWETLVPLRNGVSIHDMDVLGSTMVLLESKDGKPQVSVMDLSARLGTAVGQSVPSTGDLLALSLPPWVANVAGGANLGERYLRLVLSSPVHPDTPITVDLHRAVCDPGYRESFCQMPPPRSESMEWARMEARARDGVAIPITIMQSLKEGAATGPSPTLIEVYGAYGTPLRAEYRPELRPLIERGWIVAQAHVRGGGEKGRAWHRAARGPSKHVSVSDTVACIEHLVSCGLAKSDAVIIRGESAGGIVLGQILDGSASALRAVLNDLLQKTANAVLEWTQNSHPGLVAGVIGQCPFLDVAATMATSKSLLELLERDEWGDPATPEGMSSIASTCPYWNIPKGVTPQRDAEGKLGTPWPPVMVTGGLLDDRVDFSGILRWVARARRQATDGDKHGGPVIFDFRGGQGHFGSQPWALTSDAAREMAFAIWAVERRAGP